MKKFNIFKLSVVKCNRGNDTYQYFICKNNFDSDIYTEVFTNEKIKVSDTSLVEPLCNYYSLLTRCNYQTRKPLMLSKKDLLEKYNDINYVNLNLEIDEETIECELQERGIFEQSKVYKNRDTKKGKVLKYDFRSKKNSNE